MKKYLSIFVLFLIIGMGLAYVNHKVSAALPVCSDFIDNDGDGLVDIADPQCHTDGDASNPGSWDEFGTSEKSSIPPVVNAGPDQIITSTLVTTPSSATASDADGTIVTYEWTLVSGPAGSSFSSPATLATDFANLVPGIYVFKLKVTDNDGLTAEDDVQITVNAPTSGGGSGGGSSSGCILGSSCGVSVPTVSPVIAPVPPVGQVLGATQIACGPSTGRPCLLQKTGGVIKASVERLLANKNANSVAAKEGNSLVIKSLGINKHILQLPTIDALFREAMISPASPSTPDKGGNTVLIGHAYYSRNGVQSKSTFFDLGKMKIGEEIEVTWKGVKYTYVVSEAKQVKPDQIEVEDQTADETLTIYSCGKFTNSIRNVVVAKLKKA